MSGENKNNSESADQKPSNSKAFLPQFTKITGGEMETDTTVDLKNKLASKFTPPSPPNHSL